MSDSKIKTDIDNKDQDKAFDTSFDGVVKTIKEQSVEDSKDRVDATLEFIEKLIKLLSDIAKAYEAGTEFNPEFLAKVLKPTFVQAENTLPDLRDLHDDLMFKEDARHIKLASLIDRLECEGIEPLLPLLNEI